MRAAIQIGMGLALVTDGKGAADLACLVDVKRHRLPTLDQIAGIAQRQQLVHG